MATPHGPEMAGNTSERPKGCTCHGNIGDGYFDLPCPVHDKSEKLTPKQRKRAIKKLLAYAKSFDW